MDYFTKEADFESAVIALLQNYGWERNVLKNYTEKDLIRNWADILFENNRDIDRLNNIPLIDEEMDELIEKIRELKTPLALNSFINGKTVSITRKNPEDKLHFNKEVSLKIYDRNEIAAGQSRYQIVQQPKFFRKDSVRQDRRGDLMLLINGMPVFHIELKRSGVPVAEATNQIKKYAYEGVFTGLFALVQVFVAMNPDETLYFANPGPDGDFKPDFYFHWADANNEPINYWKDVVERLLSIPMAHQLIGFYTVADGGDGVLKVMRSYQYYASNKISDRVARNDWKDNNQRGGYIWHTTGSGKTLTSFKTAKLATELDFIDKVFFVVDRKDLDFQTMKEYQRFQPDSVNGSKDTKELKQCIEKRDNRIVVTTIQKLNEFVKKNPMHEIYDKQCVLIFDECHRSQFGDAQKNIRKTFKKYYQFGFTGTPIFAENSLGGDTTAGIFGAQLHSYVITDAIRDGKVLKFKVDYNNILPKFKSAEREYDEKELKKLERKMLLHPERITEIAKHILNVFDAKTHRNVVYKLKDRRLSGFNAMLAVQSVDAAKLYYEEFKKLQSGLDDDKRLKIATIYSFAANEEQRAIGDIDDENFNPDAMDSSAKEFLDKAIDDYNKCFTTNFSTAGNEFQNYYKDLSKRVKQREVDLLIVVGMFLTGFDAPTMNTLFVDKNLRYHGLIQAFSRTNRILNKVKAFGNIVCFRDLEKATKDAIKTFGDENSVNVILERSYDDYINGFCDEESGKNVKGYIDICNEILAKFPDPTEIELDADKKEFVELFGELLKAENILKNFDEFENFEKIISDRQMQDMKSVYVDIREDFVNSRNSERSEQSNIDFSDVEFEIDLLKTDEINLDYILALILSKAKESEDIENLKSEVRRVIRSSLGTRDKEELIIDFINSTRLSELKNTEDILESFYSFAKEQKNSKINKLIEEEKLKSGSNHFIEKAVAKGYVDYAGDELDSIIPPTSRRQGAREKKKMDVLEKIKNRVDVFVGI